jgi:hypothetical protein
MLGVSFDPEARRIRLARPRLPALVGNVTVRNLSLAGGKVDFTLHRQGARVALQVLRSTGGLEVALDGSRAE